MIIELVILKFFEFEIQKMLK